MSVSRMQSVEDEARVSDDRARRHSRIRCKASQRYTQNLYPRVIREFETLQRFRDGLALQYADVNRRSIFHQQTTFAFGLVGVLLVVLALVQTGSGAGPGSPDRLIDARLLVVLTIALPQLYFNFSELARMLLQFQIAGVSAQRLSQYQAFSHLAGATAEMTELRDRASHLPSRGEIPGAIVLRNIRYQFHPDGAVRGGPMVSVARSRPRV